jgi:hypothetical protein
MSDETTNDEIIFPRVTDEMGKVEIVSHILEMHGAEHINGVYLTSKTKLTKEVLILWHNRVHEIIEDPAARYTKDGGYWREDRQSTTGRYEIIENGRRVNSANAPLMPHRHANVLSEATDDDLAMVSKARNNEPVSDKPLNVSQRKVLKELVDNDFDALKSETQQFASDALEAKKAEIETDWADAKEKVPAFVEQLRELKTRQQKEIADLNEKHERQRQRIRDAADKAGILVKDSGYHGDVVGEVQGLKDAIAKAVADNRAMTERALLSLQRQRLTAQRRVLLSGVDADSAKILDTIPDAQTLMVNAQRQQAELTQKSS